MNEKVIEKLNLEPLGFLNGEAFVNNCKLYEYTHRGYLFHITDCYITGKKLPEGIMLVFHRGLKNGIRFFVDARVTHELILNCPLIAFHLFLDEMIERIEKQKQRIIFSTQ